MLQGVALNAAKSMAHLVGARTLEEVKHAWGLNDQLENLNKRFLYVQALLEDAGSESHHPEGQHLVNLWLNKVKEAAYDADDVMDDYAFEMLRRKVMEMTHKVEKVLALFDELLNEATCIRLRQVVNSRESLSVAATYQCRTRNRQHADAVAVGFVGRVVDQQKLVEVLCSPTNTDGQLSVVAIVAMGDRN